MNDIVCSLLRECTNIITNAAELNLSGLWLFGSPIIRIGFFLKGKLPNILQFQLALKLPVIGSSTVRRHVFHNFKSGWSIGSDEVHTLNSKGKGKEVPSRAWSGPDGPRKLRFPDYMTTAQDGDKVVSLRHRPPLPPGNALLEAESIPGP
jgi:hypothetical protein